MAQVTVPEILRCLKRDGYTPDEGARYCRTVARNIEFGAFTDKRDAATYQQAADTLEGLAKSEKLALDYVHGLEEENTRLLQRIGELEKTVIELTQKQNETQT